VKNFLKDSNNLHVALLTYRATLLPWCGISPAELSMGRKLGTSVPESEVNFKPLWPNLQKFRSNDEQYKKKQKRNVITMDATEQIIYLSFLMTLLCIRNGGSSNVIPGRIVTATAPRSCTVETPTAVRGCLDVMDHTLTTGQLAMFLQRLHADNNTI